MPAPTTNEAFLSLVRQAELVDRNYLEAGLQRLTAAGLPGTPHRLADLLVDEGILTYYQAVQLLKGRSNCFRIGPYRILERLGFGATSNVYLCEHQGSHARVAVKVLTHLQAQDPVTSKRFFREARAATNFDHQNLVKVCDLDWDGNDNFMVMDFVDGSSVQDIVQQFGRLDVSRSAHYISQAALGLHFLYQATLVHRDIRPANLLVDRKGTIKILDMGLARVAEEEGANLTRGEVLGSPEYLSPEQAIDSHNVDIRADIYSLGGTFYFMLTGEAPYSEEKSTAGKLLSKASRPPKPIDQQRSDVPEEVVAIVDKMMAKDPHERFQTPREVADALKPWTKHHIDIPDDREMPQLSPVAQTGQLLLGKGGPSTPEEPGPSGQELLTQLLVLLLMGLVAFAILWGVLGK